MAMANITVRVDSDDKKYFSEICSQLGLSVSTAFNIFLKKVVSEKAIPFTLEIPNKTTIEAIEETERMLKDPDTKYYTVEEALEELKK